MPEFDTPNYLGTALAAFSAGRQRGQDMRKQNALAQYAGGDRTGGMNALLPEDPELAMQVQRQGREDDQFATRQRVGGMAASGDYAGAQNAALAGGDFDAASHVAKLDDSQKALALEHANVQAGVLASVKTYPLELRKQAIASIAPQLVAAGMNPQQIASFDPTDANIAALEGQVLGLKGVLEQQLATRRVDALEAKPVIVRDANGNSYQLDQATGQVKPLAVVAKQYAPRTGGRGGSGKQLPPLPPGARLVP